MKIYKVKVNGKAYEVELEAVDEKAGHIESAPQEESKVAAPSTGAEQIVKAPMAGTILSVKVSVGQIVKAGDTLAILEAMKLENEVKSQVSGVVKEIKVAQGASVKNGDPLLVVA